MVFSLASQSMFSALSKRQATAASSSIIRRCSSQSISNQAFDGTPSCSQPIVLPPKKKLAIVTCMDARINPFKQLGFEEGDAHIIRNAGGVARDALRSLIVSQRLLGTREIAVYHHTGCGAVTFTSESLRQLIKDTDPGNMEVQTHLEGLDFLEFADLEQSVLDDVKFLQNNPLILKETKVTGWIHYVETGEAKRIV